MNELNSSANYNTNLPKSSNNEHLRNTHSTNTNERNNTNNTTKNTTENNANYTFSSVWPTRTT